MAAKSWSLLTPADDALKNTVPGLIRDVKEHAFTASGFYAEQQSTPDDTIAIYAGIVYFGITKVEYAGLAVVDLGTGGAFETTALTASYYNKMLFTIDSAGTLAMTEGTEHAVLASVVEPAIPAGKFPICMVSVQDDGTATAGTILTIEQSEIQQLQGVNSIDIPAGTKGQVLQSGGAAAANTWVDKPNKNIIINGDFRINQRVYISAATLATTVYGHDRWKAGAAGGDYSFTQLNSPTVITIAAGKTLIQVVEDKNVYGGTYTLSWQGTAQGRYAINSATPAGAYADSPIAITGQTAGTTMSVEFDDGTLGEVQLELGSAATAFEYRDYGTELAMCQRYYERYAMAIVYANYTMGFCNSTTQALFPFVFFVKKRATPTVTFSAVDDFNIYIKANGLVETTSVAGFEISEYRCGINAGAAAGLTAGEGCMLIAKNSVTTWIAISAEL